MSETFVSCLNELHYKPTPKNQKHKSLVYPPTSFSTLYRGRREPNFRREGGREGHQLIRGYFEVLYIISYHVTVACGELESLLSREKDALDAPDGRVFDTIKSHNTEGGGRGGEVRTQSNAVGCIDLGNPPNTNSPCSSKVYEDAAGQLCVHPKQAPSAHVKREREIERMREGGRGVASQLEVLSPRNTAFKLAAKMFGKQSKHPGNVWMARVVWRHSRNGLSSDDEEIGVRPRFVFLSGFQLCLNTNAVHLTEIRTLISPSSAVELNTTSALANYATEAGNRT
uniref:Uncharacterized protein n=1 Tax=Timema douglasi TaxID=61478 RepID=A0A7R8VFB2_TIMDO|nr:unnamed protein product [Timema douglasi]